MQLEGSLDHITRKAIMCLDLLRRNLVGAGCLKPFGMSLSFRRVEASIMHGVQASRDGADLVILDGTDPYVPHLFAAFCPLLPDYLILSETP